MPSSSVTLLKPGIGKSQACLGCCASLLLEAVNGKEERDVIYFDTELKFSAERLKEILMFRRPDLPLSSLARAMDRVLVRRVHSVKELYDAVQNLDAEIIASGAKLVILIRTLSVEYE
jgi:hypothetical protein